MDHQKSTAFLRAKVQILADALVSTGAARPAVAEQYRTAMLRHIGLVAAARHVSQSRLKEIDQMIEAPMLGTVGLEFLRPVKAQLRAKFGCDRLGEDLESVLKRVVARGAIRTTREAEILTEARVSQENDRLLGEDTCLLLDRMLASFAPRKRRA